MTPYEFADGTDFRGTIYGEPDDNFGSLPNDCTLTNDGTNTYCVTLARNAGDRDCFPPSVSYLSIPSPSPFIWMIFLYN